MKVVYSDIFRSLISLILGISTGMLLKFTSWPVPIKIAIVVFSVLILITLQIFVYQSWEYLKWKHPYDIAMELKEKPSGIYLATGIQLDFKSITVDLTKADDFAEAWYSRWKIYQYNLLNSGNHVAVVLFNDRVTNQWYCMTQTT